jgi:hypothetical protein
MKRALWGRPLACAGLSVPLPFRFPLRKPFARATSESAWTRF